MDLGVCQHFAQQGPPRSRRGGALLLRVLRACSCETRRLRLDRGGGHVGRPGVAVVRSKARPRSQFPRVATCHYVVLTSVPNVARRAFDTLPAALTFHQFTRRAPQHWLQLHFLWAYLSPDGGCEQNQFAAQVYNSNANKGVKCFDDDVPRGKTRLCSLYIRNVPKPDEQKHFCERWF